MKFQRFKHYQSKGFQNWQFNLGRLQLNWTPKSKEYSCIPWGLRVWYNGKIKINGERNWW